MIPLVDEKGPGMGEKESASQFASDGDLPDGSDEPIPGKDSKEQLMSGGGGSGAAGDPCPPDPEARKSKTKSNQSND